MSIAAQSAALAARSACALDDWHVVPDQYGIVELVNSLPESVSSVKFWSLRDRPVVWPAEQDKLQVELMVTLPWLEQRLLDTFGTVFSNEMGKTVSVFLHRLVPAGRSHASGFQLSSTGVPGTLSLSDLAKLINSHGIPFLRHVARGDVFGESDFLSPKLLDPVNWAVRRAVALKTLGRQPSAFAALTGLSQQIERDLEVRYAALAAVSRAIDPALRVRADLVRLQHALEILRSEA